jgi:GT2 family glycosyltransferase
MLDSLANQTYKVVMTINKDGEGDTVSKMASALETIDTDVLVWLDDDAVYPDKWIESLVRVFQDSKVAYAAGTCLPLSKLDGDASDAEKCIDETNSTVFGSFNTSQRLRPGRKTEERDETNLMGSGMYRTIVMKEIFKEPERVPPEFSETYIIHTMRRMGFKTMYVPGGSFYHKARPNIFSFSRQIFRSGIGRMLFFKQYPSEALKKFYMLIPMFFLLYLTSFFTLNLLSIFPITGLPLTAYVALLMIISFGFNKHKSKWLWAYYLIRHLSYGAGLVAGLFGRREKTWE